MRPHDNLFRQGVLAVVAFMTPVFVVLYVMTVPEGPWKAVLVSHLIATVAVVAAGFAYFRLGRYDRAVELLEQAVAADPESSEAQLNLGLIYYDLGRFEDALAPLEAALAGNPGLAQTTVNTGAEEPVTFTALLEEVRGAQ